MNVQDVLNLWVSRQDRIGGMIEGRAKSFPVQNGELASAIQDHLDGKQRAGLYPLLDGDLVQWAVVDYDSHGDTDPILRSTRADVSRSFQQFLAGHGIKSFREISKSGLGNYHVWIFFDSPVPAATVRSVLFRAHEHFLQRDFDELNGTVKIEIFPKQDKLNGGIGNFVWLPMYGEDVKDGRTCFIDDDENRTDPVLEQNSPGTFSALVDELAEVKPAVISSGNDYADMLNTDVPEGQRHNTLAQLVGHFKGKGLPRPEVLGISRVWNRNLSTPLRESEVDRVVQDLFKDAKRGFQFNVHSGDKMESIVLSPQQDLVKGLFRDKSLNIGAGEEGVGKSLLFANLGITVAVGGNRFLNWTVEKGGPVIYLNNELYFETFVQRFKQMTSKLDDKRGLERFYAPEHVPPLDECWNALNDLCAERKPVLVILDCLYFAHDLDESDSTSMKSLMRQLQALRDTHNTCIVVVHHLKKGGREQKMNNDLMRGSGVFGGVADTIVMFRRSQTDESKRILKPTKFRHYADENRKARLLGLNPEYLWFEDMGECEEEDHIALPETSQDVIDLEEIFAEKTELSRSEIFKKCEPYKFSTKTVQRLIDKALSDKKLDKPRHGFYALKQEVAAE